MTKICRNIARSTLFLNGFCSAEATCRLLQESLCLTFKLTVTHKHTASGQLFRAKRILFHMNVIKSLWIMLPLPVFIPYCVKPQYGPQTVFALALFDVTLNGPNGCATFTCSFALFGYTNVLDMYHARHRMYPHQPLCGAWSHC